MRVILTISVGVTQLRQGADDSPLQDAPSSFAALEALSHRTNVELPALLRVRNLIASESVLLDGTKAIRPTKVAPLAP